MFFFCFFCRLVTLWLINVTNITNHNVTQVLPLCKILLNKFIRLEIFLKGELVILVPKWKSVVTLILECREIAKQSLNVDFVGQF